MDIHSLDAFLTHETMGEGVRILGDLDKLLGDWDFIFVDSIGMSEGLLLGGGKDH